MSINETLINIFESLLIGVVLAIMIRLDKSGISVRKIPYLLILLFINSIIYPILFPLIFDKSEFAEYVSNEIIKENKENNKSTKKLSKKKLKKDIYESINFFEVIKLWFIVITSERKIIKYSIKSTLEYSNNRKSIINKEEKKVSFDYMEEFVKGLKRVSKSICIDIQSNNENMKKEASIIRFR